MIERLEGAEMTIAEWRPAQTRQVSSSFLPVVVTVSAVSAGFTVVGLALGWNFAFVAVLALLFMGIASVWRYGLDFAAPARLAEEAAGLEVDDPVVATYFCRGIPYGREEGLVAFVDGWLVFRGTASDWSIGNSDALVTYGSEPALGLADGFSVRIRPFGRPSRGPIARATSFSSEFRIWAEGPLPLSGDPVVPPRRERRGSWRLISLVLFCSVWAGSVVGSDIGVFLDPWIPVVSESLQPGSVIGGLAAPALILLARHQVLRRYRVALGYTRGRERELSPGSPK